MEGKRFSGVEDFLNRRVKLIIY